MEKDVVSTWAKGFISNDKRVKDHVDSRRQLHPADTYAKQGNYYIDISDGFSVQIYAEKKENPKAELSLLEFMGGVMVALSTEKDAPITNDDITMVALEVTHELGFELANKINERNMPSDWSEGVA